MDPTDHASTFLVTDAELGQLRGGSERSDCYGRILYRCLLYVLAYRVYRRLLTADDGEEIVSQAVFEVMRFIQDPTVTADEVSSHLKTALNRVRARYVRQALRRGSVPAMRSQSKDLIAVIQYKETARALAVHLAQVVESLRDRDRNLLIDHYRLQRFGFVKRGESPELAKSGGQKVRLCRARKRFLIALERRIEDASACGQSADLIGSMRLLVRNGGLDASVLSMRWLGAVAPQSPVRAGLYPAMEGKRAPREMEAAPS
jgi:hypothetical protein